MTDANEQRSHIQDAERIPRSIPRSGSALSIWDLDKAVSLKERLDTQQMAMRALQSSATVSAAMAFNGDTIAFHQLILPNDLKDALKELIKANIDDIKSGLRVLGVDPDSDPPAGRG